MNMEVEKIVGDFERQSVVDYVGFWEIVWVVKMDLKPDSASELRSLAIEILKAMLSRGFQIGYLASKGSGFEPWSDQRAESVIDRVSAEWDALGREPTIGDIAWLNKKTEQA